MENIIISLWCPCRYDRKEGRDNRGNFSEITGKLKIKYSYKISSPAGEQAGEIVCLYDRIQLHGTLYGYGYKMEESAIKKMDYESTLWQIIGVSEKFFQEERK